MPELKIIVHVDDDEDIRQITRLALEGLGGKQVHSCASGGEALALLATTRPDLILIDVMMPVMSGPALLRKIRHIKGLEEVPVVFMTAKDETPSIDEPDLQGAVATISKPFDPMTLADQLERIWSKRGGSMRSRPHEASGLA